MEDLIMQFKDNTVPGNYQQPIRNFVGRIVSDFVEEVDFVPNSNLRIWYNNKTEDYPAHRHSSLEIAIPMEGKYKYVFDDRTVILNEKEILIVPPNSLHKITGTHTGIRFIYLFKIDFMKSFFDYSDFENLLKEPVIINSETYPDTYNKIYEKFMEINNLYFFYTTTIKEIPIFSALMSVIGLLVKPEYTEDMIVPPNAKQREVYIKFKNLTEWLNLHYQDDITMDEAANFIGYSKYHFARLFKEYSGMTYCDYQVSLKMKCAAGLLADTDISIADVAFKSGFNNITSLSRNFQKLYNCSPSVYRNRIRRKKASQRS